MDVRGLILAVLTVSWAAVCYAGESEIANSALEDDLSLVDDNAAAADKRLFRYGRGSIFRYGRAPAVFRYGKRSPVFRYGKRAEEEFDVPSNEDAIKRIFRWGKRADEDLAKRIFRWGKRADVEDTGSDAEKRAPVFRYGKRAGADEDDEFTAGTEKRRIFNFGKRDQPNNIDLRADSPHVPFRFGDDRK